MAYTADQAAALTNEARLRSAQVKEAQAQGLVRAHAEQALALSSLQSDAQARLDAATADRLNAEAAGRGITADFGPFSATDQALRTERFAGKAAVVDAVKTNPAALAQDAIAAYKTAGLAARPADRQWLLQDPAGLLREYAASLVAAGAIPDATWASFAAFIVATDRAALLAM